MGLVAPQHVGSSRTRARTRVPCIGRWILNHCATREVLDLALLESIYLLPGMKLRTLVIPLTFLFTSPLPAHFLVIYYFYITMVNNNYIFRM